MKRGKTFLGGWVWEAKHSETEGRGKKVLEAEPMRAGWVGR